MAEELVKDAPQGVDAQEAPAAVGRFRLPKLFADQGAGAEANGANGQAARDANGSGTAVGTSAAGSVAGSAAAPAETGGSTPAPAPQSPAAILLNEMAQLRDGLELIYHTLLEASDRESSREKVFDTLYTELRDYKNDFIYEHLKPVVRPLLFLYDSLEQFDGEVTAMIFPPEAERRELSPSLVRDNLRYFMDQLVEALRVCEVTQMDTPQGAFNPKLHKAVEVQEVGKELDNSVLRVVRSGWYLNGQLLRPAEVVVGKAK